MVTVINIALILLFELVTEILFVLFYPAMYPVLKFKKYLAAIRPQFNDSNKGILIHAASVGEINALRGLVMKLRQKYPVKQIVLTTTTVTGLRAASGIDPALQTGLSVLDVWHLRSRQLKQLNPGLICIMETEIWFNLLAWASIHRIPVVFLNARLSDKSLRRYRIFRSFLKLVASSVREIMCQSEADALRFRQLFSGGITNAGNLKFALELPQYDSLRIRQQWGYAQNDFILVWGSSRPGEEALIISILPELRQQIPNLKLILAPRHPQRLAEVLQVLPCDGYSLFSKGETAADIHIIDVIGQLDRAWSSCDLGIVGGSFFDFGGHNPLEPAFYQKALIMGPYHRSCLASVDLLKQENAICISSESSLAEDIIRLASDAGLRSDMGLAAKRVLSRNAESLEAHLSGLSRWIN